MSQTKFDVDQRPSAPSFWRSVADRGSYVIAGVALNVAVVEMLHMASGAGTSSTSFFPSQIFHGVWAITSIGLAFFCLGLGAAYWVFARYRDRQTAQLRHDYAGLQSQAEDLLKTMQGRHASRRAETES